MQEMGAKRLTIIKTCGLHGLAFPLRATSVPYAIHFLV